MYDTLSINAIVCGACSVEWSVNDIVKQRSKDTEFIDVFAAYDDTVDVAVNVIDTNEVFALFGETYQWSRTWKLIPDTSAEVPVDTSTTGVDERVLASLQVYPNPVHKALYLKWEQPSSVRAILFNTLGTSLEQVDLRQGINALDVSEYQAGIYFLRVNDGPFSKVQRIVVR